MRKQIGLGLLLIGVSACAVGPDFLRPETPLNTDTTFVESTAPANQGVSTTKWWERLNDPTLNQYVTLLRKQNPSLRQAGERVLQAKERLNMSRGAFSPTLGVDSGASRSFQPTNAFAIPGVGAGVPDRFFQNQFNAGINTSWQIDLFGRLRRQNESAFALFESAQYDRAAVEQSLIAELLRTRVAIAVQQRLLALAQQNSLNQKRIYELVKRRYDLGVQGTNLAQVYLAEENFRSLDADVSQFARELQSSIYAFDVLLGQTPGSTSPEDRDFPVLPPPTQVATCLPMQLLDRRPDLRASELRLAASTADIGVAIADLYPNFTISGSLGFQSLEASELISSEQLAGSILGSLTAQIFQGGALRANIRLNESEAREQAAAYAENVLNALREVEDALQAERTLNAQLQNQNRAVEVLRGAERVTEDRYRKGIETLREFLETQQRRYRIEQTWLRTQQEAWNARIALYLALGGDWTGDSELLPTACHEAAKEARG